VALATAILPAYSTAAPYIRYTELLENFIRVDL
jgi:hypothetical protein